MSNILDIIYLTNTLSLLMILGMETPHTLQKAIIYFSDPDRCFEYAKHLRWPDGKVSCPRCESYNHNFMPARKLWYCRDCKKQFTLKVGTIFEDSPLGLDKWLCALWMLTNCRNGVSSYEVHRTIGVTQKSAWFMLHRLRMLMHEDDEISAFRRSRNGRDLRRRQG